MKEEDIGNYFYFKHTKMMFIKKIKTSHFKRFFVDQYLFNKNCHSVYIIILDIIFLRLTNLEKRELRRNQFVLFKLNLIQLNMNGSDKTNRYSLFLFNINKRNPKFPALLKRIRQSIMLITRKIKSVFTRLLLDY
ncbi:hypothetical protein BpHYR1_002237 [Brachionus plicatilis]|uniref:Uncharacterized protein n=1 Tax=Brachionus plicatilis TaxID=10195 RepID=A0A3M7SF91_BRAPC|nr:hypothetical protein BpHYR1_002237 [Brachionus plicatilis]